MPFMQRITWSGIALHAGALPGSPASHGCIRLPYGFAERLFGLTKVGMRVVIARSDEAPSFVSHPNLLQPNLTVGETHLLVPTSDQPNTVGATPQTGMAPELANRLSALQSDADAKRVEAEAAGRDADKATQVVRGLSAGRELAIEGIRAAEKDVAQADAQLTNAKADPTPDKIRRAEERVASAISRLTEVKGKAQPTIDAADRAKVAADAAVSRKVSAIETAKDIKRKVWPVSIFVSLKSQRLYVRQGFEPVMDIPVAIPHAEKPVGTYVFTAVGYERGSGLQWTVVSLGPRKAPQIDAKDGVPETDTAAAMAALDRIAIPHPPPPLFPPPLRFPLPPPPPLRPCCDAFPRSPSSPPPPPPPPSPPLPPPPSPPSFLPFSLVLPLSPLPLPLSHTPPFIRLCPRP